jgi:hypothetical protein
MGFVTDADRKPMKIKEAVNENCGECGRYKKEISPEIYGCDNCRKEIQRNLEAGKRQHLQMTVFGHPMDLNTEELEFCSWKCVLAYLPKIKCNHFVTLPYMHFDVGYPKKMTGKALISLLRPKRKK